MVASHLLVILPMVLLAQPAFGEDADLPVNQDSQPGIINEGIPDLSRFGLSSVRVLPALLIG